MKYRAGRVYRIDHIHSNICYVGSTFNIIRQRWAIHKSKFKSGKDKYAITPYFEKYGIRNFRCILIKEYQVVDKYDLHAKEQLWINKLKCVNKYNSIPFLREKELRKIYCKSYRKNNLDKCKEKDRLYRINNLDKCKEKDRLYYQLNRDKIRERKRVYYRRNKAKDNERSRIYHQQNKDKINERRKQKVTCACGKTITKGSYARHLKSKYHLANC